MVSRRPCEAGYKCGGSDFAVRRIRSGYDISMHYPQQVTMRSVWLVRHCKDSAELALSIAMGLIPCDMRSRDSSYHTVAPREGLAAAWRSCEVFSQLVMSASAAFDFATLITTFCHTTTTAPQPHPANTPKEQRLISTSPPTSSWCF